MPSEQSLRFIYDDLLGAYRRSWQVVTDEEAALVGDPRRAATTRRLAAMRARIESEMAALEAMTGPWAAGDFPTAYGLGGTFGARRTGSAFTWTDSHLASVQAAADQVYADLLSATRYVNTSTKDLIRRIARDQVLQKVIVGETAEKAGRAMAKVLAEHGVTAAVYSDGSRHGLDDYSEMTMRSASARAYNAGTVNSAQAAGTKYFEVFDGTDCGLDGHDSQPKVNGSIVDGDTAGAYGISHPNCTRSFGPRPDLVTGRQAREAGLV